MLVDEPELEDRFDRLGEDMDDEEAEPSQLPRRPRRPMVISSPTKSADGDDPDDIGVRG